MFKSRLYVGTVYHRRVKPKVHQLQYRVFSLLIDLDELPSLHQRLWGFSWNAFNICSIYDKDFGFDSTKNLRGHVETHLQVAGIAERPAQVFLSCYPRLFGYAFNPLSLFYCLRQDGSVFAVVHEVHNTFGERHAYVLPVTDDAGKSGNIHENTMSWIQQKAGKELFVSPFAHMDMRYQFRLNVPNQKQVLAIRLHDEEGLVLTASYSAKQRTLNGRTLVLQTLTMPFMCLKIIGGIHWEALLLWCKRVPWFSHVPKSAAPSTTTKS